MKLKRYALLAFAWFVAMGTTASLPGSVVGLRYGEEPGWYDVVRIGYTVLGIVSAGGTLFLYEPARKLLLAVLWLNFARVASILYFFRDAAWDGFGAFLFATMLGLHLAVNLLVHRSRGFTTTPVAFSRPLRAALVGSTIVLGLGLWACMLFDFEEPNPPAPPTHDELAFLEGGWDLQKIFLFGHDEHGDARYAGRAAGRARFTPDGDFVVVEGVPAFRNLEVKVDVRRNVLYLDGVPFPGTPFETRRFLWRDWTVRGVRFERASGRITGEVHLALGDTGSLFLVVTAFSVMGSRQMEYSYLALSADDRVYRER